MCLCCLGSQNNTPLEVLQLPQTLSPESKSMTSTQENQPKRSLVSLMITSDISSCFSSPSKSSFCHRRWKEETHINGGRAAYWKPYTKNDHSPDEDQREEISPTQRWNQRLSGVTWTRGRYGRRCGGWWKKSRWRCILPVNQENSSPLSLHNISKSGTDYK